MLEILILFVFGLIVGSFLNAVIFRLKSGESFLFGRSHCNHCNHELAAKDLVPLFSFIFLAARCRYCKAKLSWQYPLIELATAICFILLGLNFEFRILNLEFWYLLTVICLLIVIAVFDFKHFLILDKVVFPAFGLSLVWSIVNGHIVNSLLGAAVVSGFFLLQYLISKGRWIGFGDVKFGLFLGSLFGLPLSLIMLMLAYCIGAITGLILIAVGQKKMSSRLPFGTFLSFSAIIIMLYGQEILNWYLQLIGL